MRDRKAEVGRGKKPGSHGTSERNLVDVREELKRPARVRRSKEEAVERSFLGERTKMQHGH